ncbi:ALK and LTK ligand 1 isoform X2 [Alligator mississippiensis]|nr:ALK and LTK ligand 1 isoform X2 [Alligator mississippiensis]
MPGAKRCHALPVIVFLLLAGAAPPPGAGGSAELQAAGAERGPLPPLLVQAMGDGGSSPQPPRPRPRPRDRVIARRYSGSALLASASLELQPRAAATAAAAAASSRERAAGQVPRLFTTARHAEIFPRDSNLKDKFIKHFTGPVTFSAECSKHFHRLYHNTRDCSTPA